MIKTDLSQVKKRANQLYTKVKKHQSSVMFYGSCALLIVSIVLLMVAVKVERSYKPISASSQIYHVGQVARSGWVEIYINKTSFNNGQPPFKAPVGKQYVIVELTIKNRSRAPINILPTSDTYVKDTVGNVSYLSFANLDQPFRAGSLPAGEQIKGQLSYLVSKHSSLKLYVDAIWSGGVTQFALPYR